MIDVSHIFKELDDYDKDLVNFGIDWIRNTGIQDFIKYNPGVSPIVILKSNLQSCIDKFSANDYLLSEGEFTDSFSSLQWFHEQLLVRNIGEEDENVLDKMHFSLKKTTRQLEDLYFARKGII